MEAINIVNADVGDVAVIAKLAGGGHRDGLERELRADAMCVLIGGRPLTAGVEGWLRRDEGGT